MREAVIVAAKRSAIAKAFKGSLKETRPENVCSLVINSLLNELHDFDKTAIEDLILGCAFPEAEQGYNVARIVALLSGLSDNIPGQTVNRFCSSGLQSIATAANSIISGQQDIVLAGGMESMTMIPMGGNIDVPNPDLIKNRPEVYTAMGITAENVADKYNVTRKEMDLFSYGSHIKAYNAQLNGKFDREIVPIEIVKTAVDSTGRPEKANAVLKKDECIRGNITVEGLEKLKPAFKLGGTVTAGNSSQMSDGVGFALLMEKNTAKNLGYKPVAKFVSFAVTGLNPKYMGLGPIEAIKKVLNKSQLKLDDIDLFELNEAFASQAIACIKELGLDSKKVNVNGGAIAMGHPLGATGTILTIKLINELSRINGKYGIVSMCIGGGMGAAGLFEVCG